MTLAGEVATAVLLGAALATGILLVATRVPRWAAPTLAHRIAPYLRDIADPRGLTPLAAPRSRDWASWGERALGWVGSSAQVHRRLRQAGWSLSVGAYRVRQLACAIGGLIGGGLFVVALALAGRGWAGGALLPPVLAVVAVLLCDAHLSGAARRRMRRIQDEVPTVLEFLALCLAAGESLLDALRRVGEIGVGELTGHLRRAVLATGTGSSLADALRDLSRELDVASVSRAIEQIVAAIERGAPLAHVLHAQAVDAREEAKRALIEQAGRKEILMLLPLVFLVLPLSVLFAVFPGVVMLRLGL